MGPLVTTDWLAAHLDDPDLRVLEPTVGLQPAPGGGLVAVSGRPAWDEGHIPRSAYADLAGDLSDPTSPLRFTMPSPERFAAAMEALGVGAGTRVVVYDRRATMWATRLWWMLRAFGFDDAAVLDGGWRSWTAEGRAVSTEPAPSWPPATFTPRPRPALIASIDEVRGALGDEATCIVNALSAAQHRGDDLTYGRAGHLPGALNVPAAGLVDPGTDRYLPLEELRARFADVRGAAGDDGRVITYCGGGIAATSDAFVLTLLGHRDVAVYDGSLGEWAADPSNPMTTADG